jgi:phosphoenolpyruvate phosphomutase
VTCQGKQIFAVARTESLIANADKAEAVRRILAYAEAGADAVLVHSRAFKPLADVVDTLKISVPIIAIPTFYPDVNFQQLLDHNIAAVVLANQALRASIKAIVDVLSQMKNMKTLSEVEDRIISLNEIEKIVELESYCL